MELTGASIIRVPEVLRPQTIRDFHLALEAAVAEPTVACVLTGASETFCLGLRVEDGDTPQVSREAAETFASCLERIRLGPKPVLALVDGAASGGGVGLAAACDGVLATTDATFVLPELIFGLTPAIILPFLSERVAAQKLRWMAMTATSWSAREALESGLVDAVSSREKAGSILRSWIRRLKRVDRNAIAAWKQMTGASPWPSREERIQATLQALDDTAVRRRLKQFLESGEPPWERDIHE
jgi:enoyl-CoA hydratase/carnithine racemase